MLLVTDKEKIRQEKCTKISHFSDLFDASSETSGSSFGDNSSSSVGQAKATGCSHANMDGLGRSVGSYGQQQLAKQQHHSLIKPSQQSSGANSNTPPQLSNMLPQRNDVQPYFPNSGPSMSCKDCVAGSRPNENTTTTTTLKCLFCSKYVEHTK